MKAVLCLYQSNIVSTDTKNICTLPQSALLPLWYFWYGLELSCSSLSLGYRNQNLPISYSQNFWVQCKAREILSKQLTITLNTKSEPLQSKTAVHLLVIQLLLEKVACFENTLAIPWNTLWVNGRWTEGVLRMHRLFNYMDIWVGFPRTGMCPHFCPLKKINYALHHQLTL